MKIDIYRLSTLTLSIEASESSQLSKKLNGEDICRLTFIKASVVDLKIGDWFILFGQRYTLNLLPGIVKKSSREYQYDCIFESELYLLRKVQFRDGVSGEFPLTGDLTFFAALIATNINRIYSGYQVGVIETGTATKTLTFSNENCLSVLQRLCTEYSVDFKIVDKTINLSTFEQAAVNIFQYGKGKGLYQLTRKTIDSKDVITRLYLQGATRNIPANYRNYSTRLTTQIGYVESNVDKYGIIERTMSFDDIYPRFTGAITQVTDLITFQCSAIDFDVNAQLIAGTTAKIKFNTGALAGYEFDISSYTAVTKQIVIKYQAQEKLVNNAGTLGNYQLPSSTLYPSVGDSFVFIDIVMPQAYIDNAEAELQAKGLECIAQNNEPRVQYTLDVDPIYMKNSGISLNVGDYVNVQDTELGLSRDIRITALTRSIYNQYYWKLDLSDQLAPQKLDNALAQLEDIKRLVVINRLNDIQRALNGWRTFQDIQNMIFDSDGTFNPGVIKPESIQTLMLSVGARAGNFTLSSTIEANYLNNPAYCKLGAGQLVHLSIEANPRTWDIAENNYTNLVDSSAYYIYAQCSRTGNSGTLLLDTAIHLVDSDPNNYMFPVGIISSVMDGYRMVSMTYGSSALYGRNLRAGAIINYSGVKIMDIDTGEFFGKFTFRSGKTDEQIEADIAYAETVADAALTSAGGAQNAADSARVSADSAAASASAAYTAAASKSRNFYSQPTVPYYVGDTWTNGVDLYTCHTTRLGGSFDPADWLIRVAYDATQTVIDGGLVTAGSFRVKDIYGNIWGGIRGGGYGNDIGLWLGSSDPVNANFWVKHNGAMFATAGSIAGWTLASDAIFVGTKKTSDGFTLNGITIAANGSIHAKNFSLNQDGSIAIRGTRFSFLPDNNMVFTSPKGELTIDSDGASMPFINIHGIGSDAGIHNNQILPYAIDMRSMNFAGTLQTIFGIYGGSDGVLTATLRGLRKWDDGANSGNKTGRIWKNLSIDTLTGDLMIDNR